LIDEEGHYLIERHAITYSPSGSILVRCMKESSTRTAQTGGRALIVGDPTFDRLKFPALRALSDARVEAATIHSFYPGSTLLVGNDATEKMIRSELKSCEMAHFAVHCVVDERSPWQAALLLARPEVTGDTVGNAARAATTSSAEDGVLYLDEIYTVEMEHLRLIVLSTCESALGKYYRGEGIVSLVRPFIAARVPSVVATLWPVESRATSEFMEFFHEFRRDRKLNVAEAIRQAQLKVSRETATQSPYYWAPFVVEGSGLN